VLKLTAARRRNLLLHWLDGLGLPAPTARHIEGIEREVLDAREDASPVQRWPGVEVRRYRDELFAMQPLAATPGQGSWIWRPPQTLQLPAGLGSLATELGTGRSLRRPRRDEQVTVRLAKGGEKIRLPGRSHHHALKDLLQKAGVPPWVRRRLPLVCYNRDIAAVADFWVCDGFGCAADQPGYDLRWMDPPPGTPRGAEASTW
jgi:tRNA(Ile)-lysidine synthase